MAQMRYTVDFILNPTSDFLGLELTAYCKAPDKCYRPHLPQTLQLNTFILHWTNKHLYFPLEIIIKSFIQKLLLCNIFLHHTLY